ncbi:MAG: diheme cytochrome c-553 [Leptospiraceae bacterium]|nr:diheme cytochrome c-553 [Leptospiraceae bacterium]
MKKMSFTLLAIAILEIFALVHCTNSQKTELDQPEIAAPGETLVKKGEYLVGILGCHDCHSPKRMGPQGPELIPELMLSGYPASRPFGKVTKEALANGWSLFNEDLTCGVGPWGASFAANITSDETGIGNWSLEQFKKALTQGKSKGLDGGRMLLPPMPWFNYKNMKDEDIEAIFNYLKSTNPVSNVVPAPIPPDALK